MNYFILYQIALDRHNDDLKKAAQARLRQMAQAGQNSEDVARKVPVAIESLIRTTIYKMAAIYPQRAGCRWRWW